MNTRILVAFLICLALIVPALGTGVNMYTGVDAEIASAGATSDGVVVDSFVNNNGFSATLTEGIRARVLIPAGVTGVAYAKLSGQSGSRFESPILNGDRYQMRAAFGQAGNGANVNVGATKTSAAGVASASSQVIANSYVDNSFIPQQPGAKRNYLSGYADISAATSNTGVGTTYAFANGQANYRTFYDNPSGNDKDVQGQASGAVDLESRNIARGGSNSGSAQIRSESNADYTTSYARSRTSIELTSARPGAAGTSWINGYVRNANTNANAKDGSTPAPAAGPNHWNVQTRTSGNLVGDPSDSLVNQPIANAQASARGDRATTNGYLNSEARHNSLGPEFNRAENTAYVATTVTRSNNRNTLTGAGVTLVNGAFSSISRETNIANRYAQESANSINFDSNAQLRTAGFTASNDKTLTLSAWRNSQNQPTHARIVDRANIRLPLTGNALDKSKIQQSASNLVAEAAQGNRRASITATPVNIDAYRDGTTPSAVIEGTNNPAIAQTGNLVVNGANLGPTNFVTSLNPFRANLARTANN